MQKILIAEGDRELRQLFTRVLQKKGYLVEGASDGREGLEALRRGVDLVVADVQLPEPAGFDLIRKLREKGNAVPVLMITAKETFDEMRHGFLDGTEEFLIKPISVRDLLQRVAVLLRRAGRRQVLGQAVLEEDSMTVTQAGKPTVLPPREFRLLYKMAASPGRIFTVQQLSDELSPAGEGVEEQISRLRERFRDCRDFQIVPMRGIGYKVVPADASH